MKPCEVCGASDFKTGLEKGRHMKGHKAEQAQEAGLISKQTANENPFADPKPEPAPRTLRRIDVDSKAVSMRAIRGIKLMTPECTVYSDEGDPISGPCKFRTDEWWLTCTHGTPSKEELAALGYVGPPAYYEAAWVVKEVQEWKKADDGTIVGDGEPKKVRHRVLKPRIIQIAASIRNSSGLGPRIALDWGARFPQEFGIAPFCEFWDCYSQDIKKYWQGFFCSDDHAVLVYADEHGTILPLGHRQKGQQLRREAMDDIRPKVQVG